MTVDVNWIRILGAWLLAIGMAITFADTGVAQVVSVSVFVASSVVTLALAEVCARLDKLIE